MSKILSIILTCVSLIVVSSSNVTKAASSTSKPTNNPTLASFRIWKTYPDGSKRGGSGTAISEHIVVTNVHIVGTKSGETVEISYPFSQTVYKGSILVSWQSPDVALVYTHTKLPWVLLGPDPQVNEMLTLYGYGSNGILSRGSGRVLAERIMRGSIPAIQTSISIRQTNIESVSGDSGGGLFNKDGELVAINWGADGHTDQSVSTPASYIRGLACYWTAKHVEQSQWSEYAWGTQCRPGMPCSPLPFMRPRNPNTPGGGGVGGKRPVSPPDQVRPQQPPSQPIEPEEKEPEEIPVPAPTPKPQQPIDYVKLAEEIYKKMQAEPDKWKGKDGKDGKDGTPGVSGKDSTLDYNKLANIIYEKMESEKDKWKGQDGKDGKDGLNGKDGKTGTVPPATINQPASFFVQFETLDAQGNIIPAGEPLEIKMGGTLFIPPQMIRIRSGSEIYIIGEKLGQPLKLKQEKYDKYGNLIREEKK